MEARKGMASSCNPNQSVLRLSKLALVAKQAGHYGRTWIENDENGLLRNVIEESESTGLSLSSD